MGWSKVGLVLGLHSVAVLLCCWSINIEVVGFQASERFKCDVMNVQILTVEISTNPVERARGKS